MKPYEAPEMQISRNVTENIMNTSNELEIDVGGWGDF